MFIQNVRSCREPELSQPLIVLAKYDDGSYRDVSDLAVTSVTMTRSPRSQPKDASMQTGPGSGFIMARFDQFTSGTRLSYAPGKDYPPLQFESNKYVESTRRAALERSACSAFRAL